MKPFFTSAVRIFCLLLLPLGCLAQSQPPTQLLPLVLTGYNAGVIASGTFTNVASVQNTTTAPIDTAYDYYAKGFNSAAPNLGLPAGNTFASAANPDTVFLIQAAGTTNNVLLLTDQSDGLSTATLTLTYPGSFNTLAVLATGLDSSNSVGYTLHFADGTSTQGTFLAPDNYVGAGQIALAGFGRVSRTDGSFHTNDGSPGNPPYLFEADLPLAATDAQRTLVSITFTDLCPGPYQTFARKVAIFGVSGNSSTPSRLTPITLAGFNQDVIADPGYSAVNSTTTTIDTAYDYYATGFNPSSSVGLPAGSSFVSAANPNTLFYLQPSGGSGTPINAQGNVLLFSTSGAFTLPTPTAYSRLAILSTGLDGSIPLQYQLNFSDGGPARTGQFSAVDNFYGNAPVALLGFGRVSRADGKLDTSTDDETYPRVYETDITLSAADAARPLASIGFTNLGPSVVNGFLQNAAIFAVSGLGASVAPAGTLAFSAPGYTVARSAGTITITVNRNGGGTGALSVDYATSPGLAGPNVDYTPVTGTLNWATGDITAKTFTVPILANPAAANGVDFVLDLTTSGDPATLGTPNQTTVSIVDAASASDPVQQVNILSPPSNFTPVQYQVIEFYTQTVATEGQLDHVEYFFTDADGDHSLGKSTAPVDKVLWVPTQTGPVQLKAVATARDGSTLQNTASINVQPAASSTDAGPQVILQGGVGDHTFAAGDTIPVTVAAVDTTGNPLSDVQAYLNGQPVSSVAAQSAAHGKTVKDSPGFDPRLFQNLVQLAQEVQLLTISGKDALGRTGISAGVLLYTKSSQSAALTCAITDPAEGSTVAAGQTGTTLSVQATDAAGTVTQVEAFVDQQSIGTIKAASGTFALPTLAAGGHVLSAIATDANGVSKPSADVTINVGTATTPPVLSTVTLTVAGSSVLSEGGGSGKLTVRRSGDTSTALTVRYRVSGSAQAGVDYKALPDTVTIPAGSTQAKIRVKPIDNATADGTRVVKIKLLPSLVGGYNLGSPSVTKIKITDND